MDIHRQDEKRPRDGSVPERGLDTATRRGVLSGFGAALGAGVATRGAAFAEAPSNGQSIVPLAPSVGSLFAGLPSECLGAPTVDIERVGNGVRLVARYGKGFVAALTLDDDKQIFSTPMGEFDSVLATTRPNPRTIVHSLTAFDEALGSPSSLRIRGHIRPDGIERISVFVNSIEKAEFSSTDSRDTILAAFANVRSALSETSLPFNLLALNAFAGWAPPLDEFPNYLVNIHLMTAAGGLAPVLTEAAHQEPGDSPLGRWLKCLMDCCADCGGCWDGNGLFGHVGCHRCRGTGILEGLKQATCYNLCVILCVPEGVVGPLKP